MNTKEILIIIRNIHYRCFFIGLFFLAMATIIYLPCKCYIATIYQGVFNIDTVSYNNMWASFVGLIKTILLFFFLVPALAIHWTAAKIKGEE